jgi:aryl-alcohol dehydrogenase-like predicted oxidoreductase
MMEKVPLGRSGVLVSSLGLGTNAWGRAGRPRPELKDVFDAALSQGIALVDTAEIYSGGGSERTLGSFLAGVEPARRPAVLSKFFPMPWRLRKRQLTDALQRSLDRLRLPSLDVYLIHFPWGPRSIRTWVDALADAVNARLVRAVGVSNFDAGQVRRAHAVLASRGIPLSCNEVELSLARRGVESNGTLAACRELGVKVIAYRPLALGRLAGAAAHPARGWRRLMAAGVHPGALGVIQQIGSAHGGKTPAQVALNWVICKGALPIPGATSVSHLMENVGALGWRLSDGEVAALDALA